MNGYINHDVSFSYNELSDFKKVIHTVLKMKYSSTLRRGHTITEKIFPNV